jgi:UDP-N-acetyl-2-amino-2-deoxyglucuronate dehydrogenase
VAALDPATSVGIVDSYFPEAAFFTEPELFEAYLEDLAVRGQGVDYLSVAAPNYLHLPHIRMAFRLGADAISEKPLVLWPEEVENLKAWEERTGRRVYTILQLRVHPSLVALRERLLKEEGPFEVLLTYVTGRGAWYLKTWKAEEAKSGGLATNIGIHFFDLLTWFFGEAERVEVHARTPTVNAGYLELRAGPGALVLVHRSLLRARAVAFPGQAHVPLHRHRRGRGGVLRGLHRPPHRGLPPKTLAGEGFGLQPRPDEAIRIAALVRTAPLSPPGPGKRHPFLGGV